MEQALTLNQRLQVCVFSGDLLLRILRRTLASTGVTLQDLVEKHQVTYLIGYLERLKAKTIVIESQYVDRHFLEDYANYHVRSFTDFGKLCTRLHFFNIDAIEANQRDKFDNFFRGNLIDYLKGRSDKLTRRSLQKSYLGYSIIRPLKDTFIGRTCLKTYEPGDHAGTGSNHKNLVRYFNTTKPAYVNLFGIELKIKSTLPFQEQDGEVAACASAALWSFFYGTKVSNRRQTPSPSEITKMAQSKETVGENRLNGTHGLKVELIKNAIGSFGLEYTEYEIAEKLRFFKEILYSYQHLKKEPVLLGVDVLKENSKGKWEFQGPHSITVVGLAYDKKTLNDPTKFGNGYKRYKYFSSSQAIQKLYCHDDQLGPFAKFDVDQIVSNKIETDYELPRDEETKKTTILRPYVKNSSRGDKNLVEDIVYIPRTIHLGVYHKVRHQFSSANDTAIYLDSLLKEAIVAGVVIEKKNKNEVKFWSKLGSISWSVALTDINTYKSKLLKRQKDLAVSQLIDAHYDLLASRLPRFIWCLTCSESGRERFDVIIDATTGDSYSDSERVTRALEVVYYSSEWKKAIRKLTLNLDTVSDKYLLKLWRSFVRPKDDKRLLDELYGDPAFPSEIRPHEIDDDFSLHSHNNVIRINAISYRNKSGAKLKKLKNLKKKLHIWIVDEAGNLHISEQQFIKVRGIRKPQELGHPTLVDGDQARMAGELNYLEKTDQWELSNKSGRYSIDKSMRNKEQLTGVVRLMQSAKFIERTEEVIVKFDPGYGTSTIKELSVFLKAIQVIDADEEKTEVKFDLIQKVVFMVRGDTHEQNFTSLFGMLRGVVQFIKDQCDMGLGPTRRAVTAVQYLCDGLINDCGRPLTKVEINKVKRCVKPLHSLEQLKADLVAKPTLEKIQSLFDE